MVNGVLCNTLGQRVTQWVLYNYTVRENHCTFHLKGIELWGINDEQHCLNITICYNAHCVCAVVKAIKAVAQGISYGQGLSFLCPCS